MPKRGLFLVFFSIALCVCATTAAAQAQATRTWVSGNGDDTNPCSRSQPCKTFAGAYGKTAAGGEIDALDAGGFGALNITHAITVDGGAGQVASVLTTGVPGFTINAGPTDRIVLRNLTFNGANQDTATSPGTNGITFVSGLQLAVDRCVIEGFASYGINFQPSVRSFLTVTDSIFVGNGTYAATGTGALISTTGAATGGFNRITIARTSIKDGPSGITAGLNTKMEITQLTIGQIGAGGGDFAIVASGAGTELSLDYSTVSQTNSGGLHATNGAIMYVANSSITYNNPNAILFDSGGQVLSYGNNRLASNVGAATFSGTVAQQ